MSDLAVVRKFTPGLLARVFGGAGKYTVRLRDGLLEVREPSGDVRQLSQHRVCEPIEVRKRLLWDNIRLASDSGTLELVGLTSKEAAAWRADLETWQRPFKDLACASAREALSAARDDLRRVFDGSRYVSQGELARRLKQGEAELDAISEVRWRWLADAPHVDLRADLQQIIEEAPARRLLVNEAFVEAELAQYKLLFDRLERFPLTEAQRRACVIDDDNNLVLAGAGTGKTSVIVGRIVYLLESGRARADEILAVAYNRDAARELRERIGRLLQAEQVAALTVKTFHALGKEIIAEAQGTQPSISALAEDGHALKRWITQKIEELAADPSYAKKLIDYGYLGDSRVRTVFDYDNLVAYQDAINLGERRTLKAELVRSMEEVAVANWLTLHGVEYRYERDFPVKTASRDHRQYRPDFTLRVPGAEGRVIILEHFGVDQAGNPPPFFPALDKERYRESMAWKRRLCAEVEIPLIETASWQFRDGSIWDRLTEQLNRFGIPCEEISPAAALQLLREAGLVHRLADEQAGLLALVREAGGRAIPEDRLGALDGDTREKVERRWELFEPVLRGYEAELQRRGENDFAELLIAATAYVRDGRVKAPYRQILVDEFQDISAPRANLILALRDQNEDCHLLCVGDDWQSIYRFSGSDVRFVSQFHERIGPGTTTSLDRTFRFNDQIARLSSGFVTANPEQTRKEIVSQISVESPAVSLVATAEPVLGVEAILSRIVASAAGKTAKHSVFVLARYHYELDSLRQEMRSRRVAVPRQLAVEYSTVHSAKGLEADFVIVIGLQNGRNGFPAEKVADPLLDLFLPRAEEFPFAEERRLLYVAITRARDRVYLVFDRDNCSTFVRELEKGEFPTDSEEFRDAFIQQRYADVACPRCKEGRLVRKVNEASGGVFYGCSRFPGCRYRERGCPVCDAVMERTSEFCVCSELSCDGVLPICPRCSAPMAYRTSEYGSFFGCSNFGRADPLERCSEKRRDTRLPDASGVRGRQV